MSYKISNNLKILFISNFLLLIFGLAIKHDIIIAVGIIVAVILSVTVEILEEVHNKCNGDTL